MNKKQFIAAWLIGICLLGGCANFSLKDGKAKFTILFDFPQKEDNNQKLNK